MDVSTAGVMVSVVLPPIKPDVAVITDVPCVNALAMPVTLTDATLGVADAQVNPVSVCVVPSEYVPVAVNCCVSPLATFGKLGVIAIDCKTAEVIVMVVLPTTVPDVAAILDVPSDIPSARPVELTVATVGVADDQVTVLVIF